MIVDSKNIPQFIDELNIEVDQIKKELQQTIKNVEYASEYSEGVKLGDLLVGSQSTQVIAPQITMTAGPESGQFFLELPVGTESALTLPVGTESGQIVRPEVQNDANATSLVPDALLTGQTVESYLNSNIHIAKIVTGTNTSNTGKTTFTFANSTRQNYIFACGTAMGNIIVYDATSAAFLKIAANGTITSTSLTGSNFTFEITDLDWWSNPIAIGCALP